MPGQLDAEEVAFTLGGKGFEPYIELDSLGLGIIEAAAAFDL